MEASPKHNLLETPTSQFHQSLLPSPNSRSSSSSSNSTTTNNNCNNTPLPSPKQPITRSESTNPYPTTFVQADTSSFKQVVQMLTGSPRPTQSHLTQSESVTVKTHNYTIPPIKTIPKKTQSSSSSGFKLYERRNSLKNLKINPIFNTNINNNSGFSPRKPTEILSPSILDFPALVLSPVTPLIPDPFVRSASTFNNNNNHGNLDDSADAAEEKAIKEKGFFLHPLPREAEPPRLLPLFPVTSPRVSSGSANPPS